MSNTIKKLLTGILASGMIFTVAACTDGGDDTATTTPTSDAVTTTLATTTEAPADTETDETETMDSTEGTAGDRTAMEPGVYTIDVDGYGEEPMVIEVTLTEDSIESIEVVSHSETEGIGDNAIDELPAMIVDNQTLDVDVVSGATVTSEAIVEAVREAITEAGGNPSEWG